MICAQAQALFLGGIGQTSVAAEWAALRRASLLTTVTNVDEVLERHSDFLEACLGDCMLTSPQLLKAVTTLCLVCVQFCTFIQGAGCGVGGASSGSSDSFARSVSRYGLRFTAALLSVLAIIERMARDNNTNKLLNISARRVLRGLLRLVARSVSRYGLRFTAALLSVLAIIERMARDNNTNKLLNISASAAGPRGLLRLVARSVSRYGLRFTAALLSVLAIIERMARDNNTNKLLNISARLNFNTYYAKQLEKFCSDDKLMESEKKSAAS
ncbi:hypothetical protein JYU34_009622 [Plutella xylostella]|uniref:Gamma-tubulin complex component n=1 Tax=Plutella xylostella TaxID=51655 RepID=A0ABQ7QMX9_PLUXY|nr:hypothetical protein JYU34_009622 [Plutella xylostella]